MTTRSHRPLYVIGYLCVLMLSLLWPINAIRDLLAISAGYPYADSDPGLVSEYGFHYRSSTDYVAWYLSTTRLSLRGRRFQNHWDNGRSDSDDWSDVGRWHLYAIDHGLTVDHQAVVGAIALWVRGPGAGPDGRGHVALVETAKAGGLIDVAEYDFQSPSNHFKRYEFGTRSNVPPADLYIHFERTLPGGVWNNRTPASGGIKDGVVLVADVFDNGNGGLDFAKISVSESRGGGAWSGYRIIRKTNYGGLSRASIAVPYAVPKGVTCVRATFDVFSLNRSFDGRPARQLAPMGIRQYNVFGSHC
jgi:surface antigen